MSNNPVTDLLNATDMAPYLDELEAAVDQILYAQASSNEPGQRLADVAPSIDERQAKVIVDTLRERLKQPEYEEHDPYTEVKIGTIVRRAGPAQGAASHSVLAK